MVATLFQGVRGREAWSRNSHSRAVFTPDSWTCRSEGKDRIQGMFGVYEASPVSLPPQWHPSSRPCLGWCQHCLWCLLLTLQIPWQGSGGNEKYFFENENVSRTQPRQASISVNPIPAPSQRLSGRGRRQQVEGGITQESIRKEVTLSYTTPSTAFLRASLPFLPGLHDLQCWRADPGGIWE